ncbi:hypothetical protein C8R43DRAFT_1052475 [Mycena crocata]|nr:hypothetical protein C8R43DRAFT_1052475 [Mycena crocata]
MHSILSLTLLMPSQRRSEEDPAANDPHQLSHWDRLLFSDSFDMQSEQNNNSGTHPQAQTADDIQTAALLAQLAASGNMFPPSTLQPNFSNASRAPEFNPDPSHQHQQHQQHPFNSPTDLTSSSPYGSYPFFRGGTLPPQNQARNPPSSVNSTGRTRSAHAQAGPSTSTASPDADDDDNDDYEDKRRRNTAASARFRIKKKQRTLDLERSVSDLTGRAEELEREASDLRRENGWLKEIVMLKGGRLAGVNLSGNVGYPETSARGSERRGKRRDSVDDNESSPDQSEEDRAKGSGSKGKGKAKSKKK